MKETHVPTRRAGIKKWFTELPDSDEHDDHVIVLSTLWHVAMAQPTDREYPSLGVFECMGSLIQRGLKDKNWLLRDQNIYIPYYAAYVIGSYTMHKAEFAEKAVESGVISPLMELLRRKISWVEQRVTVHALGHLTRYNSTFAALSESTRALCYSNPTNFDSKSLWRRSQAYDMKGGLAKESLMDCIMFVNGGMKMGDERIKIPYHAAARMISTSCIS